MVLGDLVPSGGAVTGRIVLGGRRAGRNLAAVRMMIEADQRAARDAATAKVLLDEFCTVDEFRELVETMPCAEVPTLAAPPAPQFGSARPYLKKKKGRA